MAARLHELHGLGYSSRFHISESDLPPGWRVEKRSPKFTVWFDEKGNRYESSLDVQHALENFESSASEGERGGESCGEISEYEPYPVKSPMQIEV